MVAEQPTRRTAERAAERRRLEAHRQPLDERWRRAVRRWKASYDEVAAILESKPYRFARTMPECPHWYTLWTSWTADGTEDAWTDELDRLWGCVVGHIRIYGVPEQYVAPDGHTWWGTYLYANDWKYWTMGTPVEQTILINRTNQEIDGGPLRRPDRWTLETLGATEMLAHLERRQAAQGRHGVRCGASGWLAHRAETVGRPGRQSGDLVSAVLEGRKRRGENLGRR